MDDLNRLDAVFLEDGGLDRISDTMEVCMEDVFKMHPDAIWEISFRHHLDWIWLYTDGYVPPHFAVPCRRFVGEPYEATFLREHSWSAAEWEDANAYWNLEDHQAAL